MRNDTFLFEEAVRIFRRHGVGIALSDASGWPLVEELTAGFVYLRLHGSVDLYRIRHGDRALDRWAERIRTWRRGGEPRDARRITGLDPPPRKTRDVWVFFDNDALGHAPKDAERLLERVG